MVRLPPLDESPEEVRRMLAPLRNAFSVALYAAQNAFAVGAVIRVAHNFLAKEIILVGNEPYYPKASMGMEKYESVVTLPDDDALLRHLRGRPLWALEREASDASLYATADFPNDVVFLFGSERVGLPPKMLQLADRRLAIPIYGLNHSLPLAVAAGIVMAEWARRHYREGVSLGGCPRKATHTRDGAPTGTR